jgi:hypothetical protein
MQRVHKQKRVHRCRVRVLLAVAVLLITTSYDMTCRNKPMT